MVSAQAAAARGPDGALYLFPRLVAKGNYSRIGIARVRFNDAGDPIGVEMIGTLKRPLGGKSFPNGDHDALYEWPR